MNLFHFLYTFTLNTCTFSIRMKLKLSNFQPWGGYVLYIKGSDPLDPTMYSSGADLKPFEIQTCRMHIEGLVLSREWYFIVKRALRHPFICFFSNLFFIFCFSLFLPNWAEIGNQNMSRGHYKKFLATFWYIYFFDTSNGSRVRASNLAQGHRTIKKH